MSLRQRRLRPTALVLPLLAATALFAPALADAAPPASKADKPWSKGTLMPGASFIVGFGDIITLGGGLSVDYFFVNGLAAGISVDGSGLIYTDDIKKAFPGIASELPTSVWRIIPSLQWNFFRSLRFSPYVTAGVGPVFYNHGGGTLGAWEAGLGAYIGVSRAVAIDIGVMFSSEFPEQDWREAWSYEGDVAIGCGIIDNPCSFDIGPRIGIVFGLGVGKGKKKEQQPPQEQPPAEAAPAVAPAAVPVVAPEPTPEPTPETTPLEPTETPPVETPVEGVEETPPAEEAPPSLEETEPPPPDVPPPATAPPGRP